MNTDEIIELRRSGLTWGQIAIRAGLSRAAVRERYIKATELSERQKRKHAEALVESLRLELASLQAALGEAESALSYHLPEGYDSVGAFIREILHENNLFTYQAAEARMLLREILNSEALCNCGPQFREAEELEKRIRLILDTPEDAEKRGKIERGVYQNSLGRCPRCGNALDNVAPGISVIAGGISVCTSCLNPGETELLRARSLLSNDQEGGAGR